MTVTTQKGEMGMQYRFNQEIEKLQPSASIALMDKARTMKAQGIDVISLAGGEPDFDTPAGAAQWGHPGNLGWQDPLHHRKRHSSPAGALGKEAAGRKRYRLQCRVGVGNTRRKGGNLLRGTHPGQSRG